MRFHQKTLFCIFLAIVGLLFDSKSFAQDPRYHIPELDDGKQPSDGSFMQPGLVDLTPITPSLPHVIEYNRRRGYDRQPASKLPARRVTKYIYRIEITVIQLE